MMIRLKNLQVTKINHDQNLTQSLLGFLSWMEMHSWESGLSSKLIGHSSYSSNANRNWKSATQLLKNIILNSSKNFSWRIPTNIGLTIMMNQLRYDQWILLKSTTEQVCHLKRVQFTLELSKLVKDMEKVRQNKIIFYFFILLIFLSSSGTTYDPIVGRVEQCESYQND